ncbi:MULTISPECIES: restriction endonuclease subunit S [Lactococcus]|uniref:restriction endonuclease subunit S n=1 Tax=Lactococcus TaxID=1357 RepID=UPI0010BEB0FD|nr:restriction endonuclease subunit S [Lactococcus lactis]MDS1011901.1 restriction endonuclease subunit S [Lactococcus lactis]TKD77960.1 restriction endonuclease subunit S [Lactococcus lactis]UXV69683.1 restriction endonuclease subunit S [Lactococcus lactis subsp. lactis]
MSKKSPQLRFEGFTDDWEERKLGELGSVAMNRRIFKDQTSENEEVPFFKIGTFGSKPDAFISRELFEEYKLKYPYPEIGDILISASGSIGRTVVYQGKDEYFQDSNIVWLKHDDRLNNKFLKQFYSIVKWQGLEGSTIKRLYNKNILDTDISIPSTIEQNKIGMFFEQLDDTIALHQRKLDLLKEQKKGYLQKMFPKNGEKVPELRFAGFADDWEERKLGDEVKINGRIGFRGYTQADIVTKETGVLAYSPTNIVNNRLYRKRSDTYITKQKYRESPEIMVKNSDILFVKTGSTLGKSALVQSINYHATVNPQIVIIRSNELDEYFLSVILTSYNILKRINTIKIGGAIPTMTETELKKFPIQVPKSTEQKKIGSFFKQLDNTIALHQRKLDLLKEQKKGFLQKMFV